MPIRFSCPMCQANMSVPDSAAGSKGACPKCGQRVEVPQPASNKTVLGTLHPPTAAFAPAPSPVPPHVVYVQPPPGSPPVQREPVDGLGIASMVLGILALLTIPNPLATLVLAAVGLPLGLNARRPREGMARAGVILNLIGLGLVLLVILVLVATWLAHL